MRGERETHNDRAAMNIQTDADARVESAENFAATRLKIPQRRFSRLPPPRPGISSYANDDSAMLNHAESSKDASPPSDEATLPRMGDARAGLKTKGGWK